MYSNSYNLKQSNKTMQKCQKILSLFQQLEPKKYFSRPSSSQKQNIPYYIVQSNKKPLKSSFSYIKSNQCSAKKDKRIYQQLSFMKQNTYNQQIRSRSRSILKQRNDQSFVSAYKKQTRYEKIMKLKVKPAYKKTTFQQKKSLLNSSFNSSRSSLNKQNKNSNKQSRLEKIMKIKIEKPKVNSTLMNYQPLKGFKSSSKKSLRDKSLSVSLLQNKQSKKLLKNKEKVQEKQERLWKQFERQRQIHQKQKKMQQQRCYKAQRRRENKFQTMIQKELKRISTQKQIQKRKKSGFSSYVYSAY